MKNNTLIYVVLVLLSLFILGGMLWCVRQYPREVIKTDTITKSDTIWRDTIIKEKELVPKYVKILERDTVYKKDSTEVVLERTSETYQKSLVSAKDTADLTFYVSGIETSLDSLKMRLKTHTEVKTVEVTKYIQKKKTIFDHVHIGLQVGYGYGFSSKQLEPYAGIGIGVNW